VNAKKKNFNTNESKCIKSKRATLYFRKTNRNNKENEQNERFSESCFVVFLMHEFDVYRKVQSQDF
jgi:hypothetical protein